MWWGDRQLIYKVGRQTIGSWLREAVWHKLCDIKLIRWETLLYPQPIINPISLSATQIPFQDLNCHITLLLQTLSGLLASYKMKSHVLYKGNHASPQPFVLPSAPPPWKVKEIYSPTSWPLDLIAHNFSPPDVMFHNLNCMLQFPDLLAFPLSFLLELGFSLPLSAESNLSNAYSSFKFQRMLSVLPRTFLDSFVLLLGVTVWCRGRVFVIGLFILMHGLLHYSVYFLRSRTVWLICLCVPSTVLSRKVGINEMPTFNCSLKEKSYHTLKSVCTEWTTLLNPLIRLLLSQSMQSFYIKETWSLRSSSS